ncbi:sensor domain-containing protein [Neobacillus muris]|uniref:sensor domain-containing protein n=1 Tax=Neobacillus muris TaxID=2941334 RepID=UPI00203C3B01|nr:GGDEF and EAL domain-containing protein [Neobacillus muris]
MEKNEHPILSRFVFRRGSIFWKTYFQILILILLVLLLASYTAHLSITKLAQEANNSEVVSLLKIFYKLIWRSLFIILPGLFLFLWFYTYRILHPIQQIFEAVCQDSSEYCKYHSNTQSQEVSNLAENLTHMIVNLAKEKNRIYLRRGLLKEQGSFLYQMINRNPNPIFVRDLKGKFLIANQAYADIHQKTVEEIKTLTVFDLYDEKTAKNHLANDRMTVEQRKEQYIPELLIVDKEQKQRWFKMTKLPILLSKNHSDAVLSIATEITEKIQKDYVIEFHANHDALTMLPNRMYFQQRITEDIQNFGLKKATLMFLDLDGFKTINDSLGHAAGDELIKQVAKLILGCIPETAVLSRMGGDEFGIWMPYTTGNQTVDIAKKILDTLAKPMLVGSHELFITASIGISIYPEDGEDVETLFRHADNAMYRAKDNGKNTFKVFTPEMSQKLQERIEIESLLLKALENDELYVVYQPKFDIKLRKITGVEALLRWNNPQLGMVPPDKFISVAEEIGLIIPIGRWVIREACRQSKKWQEDHNIFVHMAVNLSTKQFQYDGLLDDIQQILEETGLDPEWLELEITESTIMENADNVISILDEFKSMGIILSIDDFGTGYSSLSYLKRLPVTTLKIDKSFIRDINLNDEDRAITKAIIAMAKSLNLTVIAEGVEKDSQMKFLEISGCHQAQGFLIGRPLKKREIEEFLFKNLAV